MQKLIVDFLTDIRLALQPFLAVIVGLTILGFADRLFHARITELFHGIAAEVRAVVKSKSRLEPINLLGGLFLFMIVLLLAASEISTIIFKETKPLIVDLPIILLCCGFLLGIYFICCVGFCGKYGGKS